MSFFRLASVFLSKVKFAGKKFSKMQILEFGLEVGRKVERSESWVSLPGLSSFPWLLFGVDELSQHL